MIDSWYATQEGKSRSLSAGRTHLRSGGLLQHVPSRELVSEKVLLSQVLRDLPSWKTRPQGGSFRIHEARARSDRAPRVVGHRVGCGDLRGRGMGPAEQHDTSSGWSERRVAVGEAQGPVWRQHLQCRERPRARLGYQRLPRPRLPVHDLLLPFSATTRAGSQSPQGLAPSTLSRTRVSS